jgi:hypothetical protein
MHPHNNHRIRPYRHIRPVHLIHRHPTCMRIITGITIIIITIIITMRIITPDRLIHLYLRIHQHHRGRNSY